MGELGRREYDGVLLTVREYVGKEIQRLEELLQRETALREKALELNAKGVNDHLERLNGEQARLLADRERFLPRELFDEWRREDTVKAAAVAKALHDAGQSVTKAELAAAIKPLERFMWMWGGGIALIVVLAETFFRR